MPSLSARCSAISAPTRATSDAVKRSEPGSGEERDAARLRLTIGHRQQPHRSTPAGRRAASGRSCERCTSGAPRARARRPAGDLARLVDRRDPHLRRSGTPRPGPDPRVAASLAAASSRAHPSASTTGSDRAAAGPHDSRMPASACLQRGAEHPAVEVGEHLHHQLVDDLVAVELVDVDRHHVAVEVGDHGGDLGQRAGQVGELHAEAVSAHPGSLPGQRFVDVAAG